MYKLICFIGFLFIFQLPLFAQNTGDSYLDNLLDSTKVYFNKSDKEKSYKFALKLNNEAKKSKNYTAQAYSNLFFAIINEDYGENENALENFNLAIKFAEKSKDDIVKIRVFTSLSNYYMNVAEIDKCIDICQKGLQIALSIERNDLASSLYNNLSLAHWHINEYEKALTYVDKSIELKKVLNNDVVLAHSYVNKGLLLIEMNNPEEGFYYYKQAENIYLKDSIYYALTQVYINFSQEYIKQNEFQNARESLSKALINAEKSQDIIREAAVWNMFGLYYKALSYKDSTVYALEKGLHLSKESGNKRNILLAYEELANYYQLIGDSKLALAFFSEAYTLKDVVYSESKTTVAQHLNIKYETEKKEAEIAKQQIEIANKDKSITQKNIWLISIIFIATIIIILIYIIYNKKQVARQRAEEHKINNAIFESEQKERIRIARDLHDSIGQKLSVMKMLLTLPEKENIEKVQNFIDETTKEVRSISHNLVPEILNLGFPKALENLTNQMKDIQKFEIELKISDEIWQLELSKQTEVALYRIVQEIITNIVRHSQTNFICFDVHIKENLLKINIQDKGIGIDTKTIEKSNGMGWKNIFARIRLLNGNLKIQTEKQNGSKFFINIPLT